MQYGWLRRHSGFGKVCVLGGLVGGVLLGVGCDGSGSSQAGGDGGANDGGTREGGLLPGRDARLPGAGDARMRPETPISDLLTKLPITGRVGLVGTGISSCTNQEPLPGATAATPDRWCAFSRSAELGREELWVINLSKVVAGTPVQCTGADPNCVRLTQNLWTGTPSVGPRHPFAHAFDGDTLVFHADATSAATELYQGPIFAWRPGWQAPRRISSPKGITCAAHLRGEAALCLDNIEPDETKPLEFDLLAGPLPGPADPQLPRIDRIHALRTGEVTKWRAGFSRDASKFCYSTGRTPTDAENLWCFATAQMAAAAVPTGIRTSPPLLTDASRWQFSRDAQKVYFLRGFNYSTAGDPRGTLTMAPLPTGAPAAVLNDNVGTFLLLSDGTDTDIGLGLFTNVAQNRGTLRFLRNTATPAETTLIAAGIASASISPDLRYTYLSRDINEQTGLADAFVARNNEATKDVPAPLCTLQAERKTDLYGDPFSKSSGMVFWVDDVDPNVLVGKGMVANPADCMNKQQYARDIDFWFVANDDGVIFSDETDIDVVSVRYARSPDGKTFPAGGGVKLQDQASRIYSMTLPNYEVVLVQMQLGYASDGLYYAKLPFGPNAAQPDAGTTDAGVDAM